MAGKITFLNGLHPSREGELVQPVKLTSAQLVILGSYVGRPIAADEVLYIEDMLGTVKSMRDGDSAVISQDVKETLAAIARADDEDVHRALEHCDACTEMMVIDTLRQMGEAVPWDFARFRPAKLKAAAAFARVQGNDGRPAKGYRVVFARAFAEMWLGMTGAPVKPWATDGSASRDVQAAKLLLEAMGDPLSTSPIAKLLRKVIA